MKQVALKKTRTTDIHQLIKFMKKYERPDKNKIELKKYQIVLIGILLGLVFVATIILLVMFWDSIFSSNTYAIVLIVVFLILLVGGFIVLGVLKK